MPDNGAYVNRWNVVRGGHVIGHVSAPSYADASLAALIRYGAGARVSAPARATA